VTLYYVLILDRLCESSHADKFVYPTEDAARKRMTRLELTNPDEDYCYVIRTITLKGIIPTTHAP
jgi:hypothetical protein